jgi:hypothetical protein
MAAQPRLTTSLVDLLLPQVLSEHNYDATSFTLIMDALHTNADEKLTTEEDGFIHLMQATCTVLRYMQLNATPTRVMEKTIASAKMEYPALLEQQYARKEAFINRKYGGILSTFTRHGAKSRINAKYEKNRITEWTPETLACASIYLQRYKPAKF